MWHISHISVFHRLKYCVLVKPFICTETTHEKKNVICEGMRTYMYNDDLISVVGDG